jgi:fibronectin type 3 domain-containing protein
MKNYERYFAVLGLALILMTVVILVLSACSVPFDKFENIEVKQNPDISAIPVPQSVNAQTITASRIDLAWQDEPIAASYSVYRSPTENGGYTAIATVQETSYTDNSVSADSEYFYYITLSANNMGEGGKSATVRADTMPPMPPASVTTAIISATEITVTWQPVAAAESYKVYRSFAQNSGYTAITLLPITVTSFSDETVSLGNDYYYRITSVNSIGEGEKSVYAIGSVQAPAVPQGLTAVPASESSIKLEWDEVSGVTGYEVHRSTSSGGPYVKQVDTTDATWTDTGLTADTIYYYKTAAVNGIGSSGLSAEANGKTMGAMGAPTVIADAGQLTVSWTAVAGAGEYEVYCDTSSTPTTPYTTTSSLSVTITGLTNDTLYYVRLKAKNTTGITAYGGTASGTPAISPGLYDNVIDAAHRLGTQNLTSGLPYISANAVNGHNYFIVLGANESVSGSTLSYAGQTVGITLMGLGTERTISLGTNGALFTVGAGVTLTLDDKITLVGRSFNTSSLVSVSGTLVMNDGSKITGNIAPNYGGGVYVYNGAFIMKGGTISGNTAYNYPYGGGVCIWSGTFTMEGGTISGNTASSGGGVYVQGGTFTMKGGTISGNIVSYSASWYLSTSAGGLYNAGTFIMEGGTIRGNTVSASTANAIGGGVLNTGIFTMKGGVISGNSTSSISASAQGGGVYNSGTFTIEGGTISGNTATNAGGGVYASSGTFRKTPGLDNNSGIIYGSEVSGNDANGVPLKNTASNGGDAVFMLTTKMRNTTAGQTDYIDTTTGLGLNASGNPPF